MLKVKCFVCNTFCENSYVVYDSNTKDCAIIDAGFYYADEEDAVAHFIESNNLKIKLIMNYKTTIIKRQLIRTYLRTLIM